MTSRKRRRHSGRYTPRITIDGSYEEIIAEALESQEEYDEWFDHQAVIREYRDHTLKRPEHVDPDTVPKFNEKIRREREIRKRRRESLRNLS